VTQRASKICEISYHHGSAVYVKKYWENRSEWRGLQSGRGNTDI